MDAEFWKDADDVELIVAEDEEAFDENSVEVEYDIGDEPYDGQVDISINGRAFTGHFERVDFGEFGGNVEVTFSGKEKPKYVTHANSAEFHLLVTEESAKAIEELKKNFSSPFIGVDYADLETAVVARHAIPPPAPAAVAAVKQCDPAWRMRYDNSSSRRKDQPVTEGALKYFPAAIRLMSEVSRLGNEKHNPGQPMHHARGKSADHLDCAARHIMDADSLDEQSGIIEAVHAMWRLGAYVQEQCEKLYGWPKAPNAKEE